MVSLTYQEGSMFRMVLSRSEVLILSLIGVAAGAAFGLAAPVSPAVAAPGCKCTMPDLGAYQCLTPTSTSCSPGGWTCKVECTN